MIMQGCKVFLGADAWTLSLRSPRLLESRTFGTHVRPPAGGLIELDAGGTLWAGVDEGEGAALAMTGMYASRKWDGNPSPPPKRGEGRPQASARGR